MWRKIRVLPLSSAKLVVKTKIRLRCCFFSFLWSVPLLKFNSWQRGNGVVDSALACCAGGLRSIPAIALFRWFLPLCIRWWVEKWSQTREIACLHKAKIRILATPSIGEHFISARCGKKEFNLCRQYRYDREFEAGERSALRKIFEGDESPSKGIALVVANIWKLPPEKRSTSRFVVELTDGWYSVGWKVGQLDDPFRFQIFSRRLVKGCSRSNDDGYFGVQAPFETICSGCARCRAEMKKKWIFSDALLTPRDELAKQDPTLG